MARSLGLMALGALACAAGLAAAQPTITSLGSGVPSSVTNNLSGSTYVGGAGMQTTAAARWTLTRSSLSAGGIGGNRGRRGAARGPVAAGAPLHTAPPNPGEPG